MSTTHEARRDQNQNAEVKKTFFFSIIQNTRVLETINWFELAIDSVGGGMGLLCFIIFNARTVRLP